MFFKKRAAYLVLKSLHLLGDGRLREIQMHGRDRKSTVFFNGRQGAQQIEIENFHY